MPKIIIVSDAVGSTKVDLDGKSHREHAEAKISRREREAPDEEGEEIKKVRKGKVIRVESEETQDYVREAKIAEQEEVEERFFAASASNVPQKMMFSLRQAMQREVTQLLAAGVCVVINEGEEIVHDQLMPEVLHQFSEGKKEKNQIVEKKANRGRIWRMMEKNHMYMGCGNTFSKKETE